MTRYQVQQPRSQNVPGYLPQTEEVKTNVGNGLHGSALAAILKVGQILGGDGVKILTVSLAKGVG